MKSKWLDKLNESLISSFYETQSDREIEEGFTDTLSFGTAGIRSTFGIGPGRLNKFTVQKFALGFSKYLNAISNNPNVVIHYDTRHLSNEFAVEIAKVLGTNGVRVILPESYKSTPELSFAVRHIGTTAGIMITASHNPKNYNGIKVYDRDGGQLLTSQSLLLSEFIEKVDDPLNIETLSFESLVKEKYISPLNQDVTDAYKQNVKQLIGEFESKQPKIVLTSLHGTSLPLLSEILSDLSYYNYIIEKVQSQPNGDFPTVNSANPELEDTFDLSKKLACQEDAQLIVATDPDADRIGIVERYEDGSTKYFNGNEIGLLLLKLRNDELSTEVEKFMIKSVVSGALSEKLANLLNINIINVLTGFKYISEQLKHLENRESKLVLAFEESHGYLVDDFSRDKDAIQTACLLIKYKVKLTKKNLTFKDVLKDIYNGFGEYKDVTLSPTFSGSKGREKIRQIIENLKQLNDIDLPELKPIAIENYITRKITNIKTGEILDISLPQADLIKFIFEEGFIAVRPSGTEPKMKLYFSLNVKDINIIIERFQSQYIINI
ncbi:phospho-sugar mutase [Staphylococcus chromogenes]|uniref:phospho-sugar mutase n=2 Tax=Staphylococcus chromogenes TaxID=46126 RepID=UPI000D1C0EA9|nr:phospho-sugar mutase [Staphylococcus chromogenes]PTF96952.1 phosphoglucomutase [Staphylococcus chromogenes]